MPTTLRIGPYRIYFYSYDCSELRHMHVDRDNLSAKFWLDPEVALVHNRGFRRNELRKIEQTLRENVENLRDEWDSFCNPNSSSN